MPTGLRRIRNDGLRLICVVVWLGGIPGCGTTNIREATDQLLLSDAVDQSIAAIDFRRLSGKKVFLDTSYIQQVQGFGFVNASYVTSALRQQIVASGCLLQDSLYDAEVILEARIGTLGADGYQTTYGIPSNSALASAAELVSSAPSIPVIPEIAFARRESNDGAAKIAVFAYDSKTREPLWQSGISKAMVTASDTWVLGVGPFQSGSIRDRLRLPGGDLLPNGSDDSRDPLGLAHSRPAVDYSAEVHFQQGWPLLKGGQRSQEMIAEKKSLPAPVEVTDNLPKEQIADQIQRASLSR